MKLKLSTLAIAITLAAGTAPAWAVNSSSITQGPGAGSNNAVIYQNLDNQHDASATVYQNGNGNGPWATSGAYSNSIYQNYSSNATASVSQRGSDNTATAYQNMASNADATIDQQGTSTRNDALIRQYKVTSSGMRSHANIQQKKNDNTATITQQNVTNVKADINQVNANTSTADISQTAGKLHVATVTQSGSHEDATVNQSGSTTDKATVTQSGTLETASVTQTGSTDTANVSQSVSTNTADVSQSGTTDSVTATQAGTLNDAVLNQSGNGDTLTTTQNGDYSTIDATQSGLTDVGIIKQGTNAGNAQYNDATLMQKGTSQFAKILQDGRGTSGASNHNVAMITQGTGAYASGASATINQQAGSGAGNEAIISQP